MMQNYMKSEWYRITHSKEIYVITALLCGAALFMNLVLAFFAMFDKGFRYGTVNFSLNMLIGSMPMLFVAGGVIVWRLFGEEHETGVFKNAVAYGVPRHKIFLGKCVVSIAVCLLSLVVVSAVYAGSSCLLLEGPAEGPLREMFSGIGASLLCAFSAVIFAVGLLQYFRKQSTAFAWWAAVIIALPSLLVFAGMKFETVQRLAMWMPWNFLSIETVANMGGSRGMWGTPEGLMKCIAAGVAGIIIFTLAGIIMCRKQEV